MLDLPLPSPRNTVLTSDHSHPQTENDQISQTATERPRKDGQTDPCCLNSKQSHADRIRSSLRCLVPQTQGGTPLQSTGLFKALLRELCVQFKSRIKFLLPIFTFPGRNIKGSHDFSHTVTGECRRSSLHTKAPALKMLNDVG